MAAYADFSFTALWARIGGGVDRACAASGNAPRGVVVALPEAEHAALAARIMPYLAELESLLLQTLNRVDSRARLCWCRWLAVGSLRPCCWAGRL